MEIHFFSATVHQCTSPLVLCTYKFVLNLFHLLLYFSLAGQASAQFNNESVFMLPVDLYKWKITSAHPTLTIMFKNVLRTFEAEILKIFQNVQPQPKN